MLPLDKQAHFLSGAVLALALGYLLPPVYGVLVAVFAGLAKEAYDSMNQDSHTVDFWDFVATAAGGAAGGLFVYFVM